MNYPVWEVGFGAALLLALVSILHAFVSHFAVGGGLFLVVTEHRARRRGGSGVLGRLRAHTKFCVLVTVVYGAISGVGGLVHHRADPSLGHQQPDSRVPMGMGDRMGLLLPGDHGRVAVPLRVAQAVLAPAPLVRLDLFHRRVRQHGDHQRDYLLYAHAGKMGGDARVLDRLPGGVALWLAVLWRYPFTAGTGVKPE